MTVLLATVTPTFPLPPPPPVAPPPDDVDPPELRFCCCDPDEEGAAFDEEAAAAAVAAASRALPNHIFIPGNIEVGTDDASCCIDGAKVGDCGLLPPSLLLLFIPFNVPCRVRCGGSGTEIGWFTGDRGGEGTGVVESDVMGE